MTGVILGIVAGLAVGAVAGALFAHGSGPRLWASLVGCVIFGGVIGALVGGYASLESPAPGREPSDTARPIHDRPELTRDEAEH